MSHVFFLYWQLTLGVLPPSRLEEVLPQALGNSSGMSGDFGKVAIVGHMTSTDPKWLLSIMCNVGGILKFHRLRFFDPTLLSMRLGGVQDCTNAQKWRLLLPQIEPLGAVKIKKSWGAISVQEVSGGLKNMEAWKTFWVFFRPSVEWMERHLGKRHPDLHHVQDTLDGCNQICDQANG